MYKKGIINSLALCESNLEFVNRDITDSVQHDLIESTREIISLIISIMEEQHIEN